MAAAGVSVFKLTMSGDLVIDADTDRSQAGTFEVSFGGIATNGNDLSVTSADVRLVGVVNAAGGLVEFKAHSGRPMQVGGTTAGAGWALTQDELDKVSASECRIGDDQSGNLTVEILGSGATNQIGHLVLQATGAGNSVLIANRVDGTELTILASNGITVNANLLTFTGDLKLISDSDGIPNGSDSITVASGKTLSSRRDLILDAGTGQVVGLGALSLAANRDVELRSPLTSGMLALSADLDRTGDGVVRVGANSPIRVDNAPAVLSGADIELGSTISTGSGSLTFQTSRADIRIGVGDSSQTYRIDQIELNRIIDTTGLVTFGSSTQTAGISIAASEEVTLVNASRDLNVRFLTAGSVNIGSLDVNAGALLTITADADRSGNGLVDQQGGRVRVDHLVVSAGAGIDLKTSVRELT
ncbi:MAG: hypothetical protein ACKOJF_22070, partial [Planctomycetaceae bacterium]